MGILYIVINCIYTQTSIVTTVRIKRITVGCNQVLNLLKYESVFQK